MESKTAPAIDTLEITREFEVAATMDLVFESILEQMGPLNETPDGVNLRLELEPWPGGRWFRNHGEGRGHLWGHVQSIRAPDLLEIQGPFAMSGPVLSHILYRLSEHQGLTRVQFSHRAVGLIPGPFLDPTNVNRGWNWILQRIQDQARQKVEKAQ